MQVILQPVPIGKELVKEGVALKSGVKYGIIQHIFMKERL